MKKRTIIVPLYLYQSPLFISVHISNAQAQSFLFAPSACNRAIHTHAIFGICYIYIIFYRVNWCALDFCVPSLFSWHYPCHLNNSLSDMWSILLQMLWKELNHIGGRVYIYICVFVFVFVLNKIQFRTKSTYTSYSLMALLCLFFPLTQWIPENWQNTQSTHQVFSAEKKCT